MTAPAPRVGPGRPRGGYGAGLVSASELADIIATPAQREALVSWAAALGRESRRIREETASVGTALHEAVVAHETGDALVGWALDGEAAVAWEAWLAWRSDPRGGLGLDPVLLEWPMRAAPLAGTVDAVYRAPGGGLVVADWKTGRVRDTAGAVLQVAAYAWLVRETERGDVTEARIVRVPRDGGEWSQAIVTGDVLDAAVVLALRLARDVAAARALGASAPLARIGEADVELDGLEWGP